MRTANIKNNKKNKVYCYFNNKNIVKEKDNYFAQLFVGV